MITEMEKSKIIVVGGEKVHARLVEVTKLLVKKAFETVGKSIDSVVINFLDNNLREKNKVLYSSFTAPNLVSINLDRHITQMDDMAHKHYMRASTVLWYELLMSVGHELYHMLKEYAPFEEHYSNNTEALQIGPKYDCVNAEKWAKKQILALGFEHNIDPPEEWGTGILEIDMLSEKLSDWQHCLPDIEEQWAKRQQEMIDRNITWLDDGIEPHIALDCFSDWLAIEGGWNMPVWKVRLENKTTTDSVPVVEEPVIEEAIDTTEQSVPIEEVIETDVDESVVDEEGYEEEYDSTYLEETEEQPVPEFMTNPAVNPTIEEMKIAMYHTFMTIYSHMFDNCGWVNGTAGYSFIMAPAMHQAIDISNIPCAERVIANYVNHVKNITPTWPTGTISGLAYVGGTIPAVKLGIRTTTGKIVTYTAIAQNPAKESAWGKSAREGVKSMIVLRDDNNGQSFMAIRIINGQFISNPLGLDGGQATTITEESVKL